MKLSLPLSALYLACSHLCGQAYFTTASLPSEFEAGDSNQDILTTAGHRHESLIGTTISTNTSRSTELIVSANTEVDVDRSLQRWKYYVWTQVGRSLPDPFTDGTEIRSREPLYTSVAMNDDGSRFVVGVPTYNYITYSAEVSVYDLSENQWVLTQTINGNDDTSGVDVAMSGNGNRIVARFYHGSRDNSHESLGVYGRDASGTFQQLGSPFMYTDVDDAYNIGKGLGISKDGTRIIHGSPYTLDGRGKVYLYYYSPSLKTYSIIFSKRGPPDSYTKFGASVAISGDGSRIAYGIPFSGIVEVWEEGETNTEWTQIVEITNPTENPSFAEAMALSGAGTRIVIASEERVSYTGVAYVFDQVVGTSDWILETVIQIINPPGEFGNGDVCGNYVSISEDGKKVAISCERLENYGTPVEMYVAVFEQDSPGVWSQPDTNVKSSHQPKFAITSIAMTSDGGKVAMGVYGWYESTDTYFAAATVHTLGSTICHDSPLPISVQEMNGDVVPFFCKWANKGQGSICDPTETMGQLSSHCPRVCNTCEDYACVNSETSFFWEGVERECSSWLSTMTSSEVADLCANHPRIRKTCRGSCGRCLV
jgi:hypothetical protein